MPYADKAKRIEYQRRYYQRHKNKYAKSKRKQRIKRADIAKEKKNVPCADCGIKYPSYVMDFDHVRGDKIHKVSHLVLHGTRESVEEEIKKCEVVCANCHRVRTHERREAKKVRIKT